MARYGPGTPPPPYPADEPAANADVEAKIKIDAMIARMGCSFLNPRGQFTILGGVIKDDGITTCVSKCFNTM